MNPAPPNAAINPRPDPEPSWCRMCHRQIHGIVFWMDELAFHEKCFPVPRADYERLFERVSALERVCNNWRKTDTDT